MAKTVSLSTLRTNVYNRGEFRSSYLSNAEVNAMINASIAELHWKILEFNPDYLLTCRYYDVVANAVAGTGDSLTYASSYVTLVDSAGAFTGNEVDRHITIAGATASGNNGTFPVTSRTSATTIVYYNPDGATQSSWGGTYSVETNSYALPSDFWLARGVDLKDSANYWANLLQFNWGERNVLQGSGSERAWTRYRVVNDSLLLVPTPGWSEESGLRLWYVPTATVLSADGDTWDTIAGFDEWVILNCCIQGCAKEGTDPSVFIVQQQRVEKMIERVVAIGRDVSEPGRVRDVYAERNGLDYYPTYWRP
jgi:hypothetical protein